MSEEKKRGMTAAQKEGLQKARDAKIAKFEAKKDGFLEAYRKTHSLGEAAKLMDMSRNVYHRWQKTDPDFLQQLTEIEQEIAEDLEDIARERAREKSDLLLIFQLKALKPDKYREYPQQGIQTNVNVSITLPDDLQDMKSNEQLTIEAEKGEG